MIIEKAAVSAVRQSEKPITGRSASQLYAAQ